MERRKELIVLLRLDIQNMNWEEPCTARMGLLLGWLSEAKGLLEDILAVKAARMFTTKRKDLDDIVRDIRYLFR